MQKEKRKKNRRKCKRYVSPLEGARLPKRERRSRWEKHSVEGKSEDGEEKQTGERGWGFKNERTGKRLQKKGEKQQIVREKGESEIFSA